MCYITSYISKLIQKGIVFSALWLVACSGNNFAPVVDGWNRANKKQPNLHVVQRGETLYAIAFRYGLDYRELARVNKISNTYRIYPGQKLQLKNNKTGKIAQVERPTQPRISAQGHITVAKKNPPKTVVSTTIRKWVMPTQGDVIKGFNAGGKGHQGLDIAGKRGQSVVATAGGQIAYSGNGLPGYGNLIIIKHNEDFLSAYAHNQRILVKEGEWVTAGQRIAEMGDTGTNRVMLHFQIRYHGKPIDPKQYLS